MKTYVAFMRGINVGGNGLIKMDQLRDALSVAGLENVRTYIQSGNVLFDSPVIDNSKLAGSISASIKRAFDMDVAVAVFTGSQWREVIKDAPAWWGKDPAWKHNIFIVLAPTSAADAMEEIGELKPGMEKLALGKNVMYQSYEFAQTGRATTGSKLVSRPIYKQLTIRNFNTAQKIALLVKLG